MGLCLASDVMCSLLNIYYMDPIKTKDFIKGAGKPKNLLTGSKIGVQKNQNPMKGMEKINIFSGKTQNSREKETRQNTRILLTCVNTGERLFTRYGFRELLEKQAVDIIQPDPCACGGILETKKIAAIAETYYVYVAPHNPMGPVATAVCAHIDASIPNFLIQEYIRDDKPLRSEVVVKPWRSRMDT